MREHSREQRSLNENMEAALAVIVEMSKDKGKVNDEELYAKLNLGYGIEESEAVSLLAQLIKLDLVYSPEPGYTKIGV